MCPISNLPLLCENINNGLKNTNYLILFNQNFGVKPLENIEQL